MVLPGASFGEMACLTGNKRFVGFEPVEEATALSLLTEPTSIRSYLEGVGLPARPPPIAPARPAPQTELEFAA